MLNGNGLRDDRLKMVRWDENRGEGSTLKWQPDSVTRLSSHNRLIEGDHKAVKFTDGELYNS